MQSSQRCGVIAIVGAPNAGKSTLVNALVGQKVAITSPKAQTTRTRVMGVAIEGDAQLVLVDTPGVFAPKRRLDRAMVQAAWGGAQGADLIAMVIDGKAGLGPKLEPIIEALKHRTERKWLIINKVDIATKERLLVHTQKLNDQLGFDEIYFVSAGTGDGLPELKTAFANAMPEGPWHFPRIRCRTPPTACWRPKLPANNSIISCTPNSPMPPPSIPSSIRSATTVRSKSTSRYWSAARPSARSCWARAGNG
ncbi:GTPase [Sphingobium sp. YG1]|nr:GTPase [Sphingobium sp. YG1]